MDRPTLLAIPNVSEGRDRDALDAIAAAFSERQPERARLLDVHSDRDHHRSVFTIAAQPGVLADTVLAGARAAVEWIDVITRAGGAEAEVGQHPHVGAVDVAPVVYLDPAERGAACAEALVLGELIGEQLGIPVFLYGELTAGEDGVPRTRAQLRRGGVLELAERMAVSGHPLRPDFGPQHMHPSAGATLVAARPPLVAFNLQLAGPATLGDAKRIAALVREGGEHGLPGLRAIGVLLEADVAQVSMNVERPFEVSLAMVIAAVSAHARVASAELVGLAPAVALEGFPEEIELQGFDPARHVIENALGS
jgi:glutamate formiminotransferase / 5-formyltetrahydrofolate cyclo-ligase